MPQITNTKVDDLLTAADDAAAASALAAILEAAAVTLPVTGVGLANTGAQAIDPGTSLRVLGLNSANQLVLHTGLDDGDDLAHLVSSNQFVQLEGSFNGDGLENQAAFSQSIARIRLTAAEAVVGKRISISGTAFVIYSGASRPDTAFQLVLHPEETVLDDSAALGVYMALGVPTTKELLSFTLELNLAAGATGKFLLQAVNSHGGFHFKDSAGTSSTAIFGFTSTDSIGTLAADQDVLISIYASDYGGTISSFIVGGALSVNIYTP